MVGRKVLLRVEKSPAQPGEPVLEVERTCVVRDAAGVTRVKGISFTVRAGEIVGIAGVAGNGQSELLEALAGIRPIAGGRVSIKGRPIGEVAPRPHPRPRARAGGPAAHGPGARVRRLRERDPRLSARPGVQPPRLSEQGAGSSAPACAGCAATTSGPTMRS